MLPLFLGLLLFAARGIAQDPATEVPPSPSPSQAPSSASPPGSGAATPSPSNVVSGALKECPVSTEDARTTFTDEDKTQYMGLRQMTTGSSVCSLLGVESFDGDVPFRTVYRGTSGFRTTQRPELSSVNVVLGDVLVQFSDDYREFITGKSVEVLYKPASVRKLHYNAELGPRIEDSVSLANLTSHPLAQATAGDPPGTPPAAGRRLQHSSPSSGPRRRLLASGATDGLCDLSKTLSGVLINATQALGDLCPAADSARQAAAKRVMQTCAAALGDCRAPEPLEAAECLQKRSICYARLAQLVVCADAHRLDRALKSDSRQQLGCDVAERDPSFSKGCSGWVHNVQSTSEASLAESYGISVEDLRAANAGRAITNDTAICVPARQMRCGETQIAGNQTEPAIFTIPLEGSQSASVSWVNNGSTINCKTAKVRDQETGVFLYRSGRVSRNGTKEIEFGSGTREIAVSFESLGETSITDPQWKISVACA